MRRNRLTLLATACCLTFCQAAEAREAVVVAVFNIEFKRVKMARSAREALRDYIEVRLAASRAYEVVPKHKIKKVLSKRKLRSYQKCFKESCQIELGAELSADRTLATKAMRIGRVCVVAMNLYHLKRMTSVKGVTVTGKCTEQGIMTSIREAVTKLSGGRSPKALGSTPGTGAGRGGLIWVPFRKGIFIMGSNHGNKDETPVHRVIVRAFSMLKTEVTTAQYLACVKAGVCRPPNWDERGSVYNLRTGTNKHYHGFAGASQPVVGVAWKDARTFCGWAGGRLPSAAEWEYAARSGGRDWKYPWGNSAATCARAVMKQGGKGCGRKKTWPVCSKPAGNTHQGLCDMAGNVWEWVEDCWHKDYRGAPPISTAWTRNCSNSKRAGRSGSFVNPTRGLRATFRNRGAPGDRHNGLGFRCAR